MSKDLGCISYRQSNSEYYPGRVFGWIIRNAKRLRRLTEDILNITRIESKSLSIKKELFNLNEMILSAILK
jgi:signal transduction histidine kinase